MLLHLICPATWHGRFDIQERLVKRQTKAFFWTIFFGNSIHVAGNLRQKFYLKHSSSKVPCKRRIYRVIGKISNQSCIVGRRQHYENYFCWIMHGLYQMGKWIVKITMLLSRKAHEILPLQHLIRQRVRTKSEGPLALRSFGLLRSA